MLPDTHFMNRIARTALIVVIALGLAASSCARLPTAKISSKIIKKHFKHYAKKYPDSVYGKAKVNEVEVTGIQEIHKNMVATEAFITLGGGQVQRIHATVERGPMGWRFLSWENASN